MARLATTAVRLGWVWAAGAVAVLPAAAAAADEVGARDLWRPAAVTDLGKGQQLRLTTASAPFLPWASPYDLASAWQLRRDELAQATYRVSFAQISAWDFKLGLTASRPDYGLGRRTAYGSLAPRDGWSALPMFHLGSDRMFGERWRLSLSADGTLTARGHALELGMAVDYRLGSSFSLYGGYRLTDASGGAEDFYLPGLTNAASIGLRYRF
jgi:hypothetical protein